MKEYRYNGRIYKYKRERFSPLWSNRYHYTFYDGDIEMFVYEEGEFLDEDYVNKFIERYILLSRREKLININSKINKNEN